MNITVLGANGKTGLEIVNQALDAGHTVNALVRQLDTLKSSTKLKVIVGDATNAQDIAKVSSGSDVVISALGASGGTLMTDSVTAIIAASKITGVKRFILISSFAVRKEHLGRGVKIMTGLMMGKAIKDKTTSEDLLRSSDLDWTIVYPSVLTSANKGAVVRVVGNSESIGTKNKIARADVAAWILSETDNNAFVKRDVLITTN